MGQPRLTDRPQSLAATFQHCDTGGNLSKRRFASAVRGGHCGPTIDAIRAIHRAGPRSYPVHDKRR
jgi:hypothetical protein